MFITIFSINMRYFYIRFFLEHVRRKAERRERVSWWVEIFLWSSTKLLIFLIPLLPFEAGAGWVLSRGTTLNVTSLLSSRLLALRISSVAGPFSNEEKHVDCTQIRSVTQRGSFKNMLLCPWRLWGISITTHWCLLYLWHVTQHCSILSQQRSQLCRCMSRHFRVNTDSGPERRHRFWRKFYLNASSRLNDKVTNDKHMFFLPSEYIITEPLHETYVLRILT